MDEMDAVDPELRSLDSALHDAAAPDAAALARVRSRLLGALAPASPSAASGSGLPSWWRYPAAGAAVLAVAVAGGLLALGLGGRGGGQGFSATVVPPPAQAQIAGSAPQTAGAAAAPVTDARSATSTGAPSAFQGPSTAYPYPIVGGSCSASPTVQFQGRGLAATGTAPVTVAEPAGTVSVTIQQTGADAASVVAAVQSRITALRDALAKVGVPASRVQVSYFSAYGNPATRQFTAYASLTATVSGADALAAATAAALQVPGVTGYSSSSPVAGTPTQLEVQDAVGRAAAQAREMAFGMASAAGVRLGDVQGVVAQPPVICYGPSGPERVVQVTVTYAIK